MSERIDIMMSNIGSAPETRDRQRSAGTDGERTTTEARQGVTGHNVRYVLMVSTVGAIVAVGIIYWIFAS